MPKALPARDSLPGPPWRTSEARRRPDIRPQLRGTRRCVTGCGLARVSLPAASRGRSHLEPVGLWLGLHVSHTARTCACACACACARARACACVRECVRVRVRALCSTLRLLSRPGGWEWGRRACGMGTWRGQPSSAPAAQGPPLVRQPSCAASSAVAGPVQSQPHRAVLCDLEAVSPAFSAGRLFEVV